MGRKSEAVETGFCRVCGKEALLNGEGKIGFHRPMPGGGVGKGGFCTGIGKLPWQDKATAQEQRKRPPSRRPHLQFPNRGNVQTVSNFDRIIEDIAFPNEEAQQQAVVAWVKRCWAVETVGLIGHRDVRFCSTNGGHKLHKATAARAVRMGYERGVPDLMFYEPRKCGEVDGAPLIYVGLSLEIKQPGNYAPPEQRQWLADLHARGWLALVSQSYREACLIIRQYLNLPLAYQVDAAAEYLAGKSWRAKHFLEETC